jgi:hypothetical protein
MIPEISIQTLRVSASRKTFDKSDLAQIVLRYRSHEPLNTIMILA